MVEGGSVNWTALLTPLQRFWILYTLLYASFGVASPFLPAYIEMRGIPPEQIGLIFGASTAIRLLSAPIAGQLADRIQALRAILACCAVAGAAGALCYLPASGLMTILSVALFQSVALAPLTQLADALTLLAASRRARPSDKGFEYGWVRGVGSAAFILGSIAAGWAISSLGLAVILLLQAGFLLSVPLATYMLPADRVTATTKRDIAPGSISALLRLPVFRRVVLVAALILGSHAMHDTFSMIRWKAASITPQTASMLWSASVVAEVIVFFIIGPPLVRRITPAGCIVVAALAGALRWAIEAATTHMAALALIQPLHGITFALLHLACMQLIADEVPAGLSATAQAFYGTVGIALATAVLTVASGWFYARMGSHAFVIMSLLCLAALPLAGGVRRLSISRDFV
jgi:MFS transporter, PPP family, 3-phenylpropionic acid transporter